MKTLFIVSEKRVNQHAGETYDYILEVEDAPTTQNIQEIADRVRTRIQSLWMEGIGHDDLNKTAVSPKVVCTVDANPVFKAMLIDLQLILKETESIEIELPGVEAIPEITDPEARQRLGLDNK
jgi:hypothetical protein